MKKDQSGDTSLLLELDEAMRRERLESLWKNYGNFIIGFVLICILAAAIGSGIKAWRNHVSTSGTEKMLAFMEADGFPATALTGDLSHLPATQRAMVLMNAGARLTEQDKKTDARKAFEMASAETGAGRDIRHLALLMDVRLSYKPESKNLASVVSDTSSPWRPYALIEAASIAAHHENDTARALKYLEDVLKIENLPPSLHAKADSLKVLYGQKNGDKK